jgi:hypothetical protein
MSAILKFLPEKERDVKISHTLPESLAIALKEYAKYASEKSGVTEAGQKYDEKDILTATIKAMVLGDKAFLKWQKKNLEPNAETDNCQ